MERRYKPVEQWISYCSKNHEPCQEAAEGYPSRLLDLQQVEKSGIIHLVEASSLVRPLPQYTTLSHCWGGSQPLRTTKENLTQHRDAISLSQLPKTYRDAAKVSLRLDIQYLWIDSLCILQDSREDWEHEAQLMATIYQNSYLTISATSSPDSHGGCFIEEHMSDIVEAWCMVQNQPGYITSGRCYYVRFLKVKEEFPKPLHSRGWVLQESSLSWRVLNLTSEQMYWQCKESFDSEDGCTTLGKLEGALSKKPRWFAALDIFWEAPNEWETADSMTRRWHLWAVGYCMRQLTFREDKLPAIAGLIRYHQLKTRDEPVLGLWRSTIAVDLRWAVSVPSENSRVSHFPSWTWLCTSSRVWSPWWPHEIKPKDTHVDLQLTDWSITWSGAPYVSRLLHSRLVVTSRMLHITLREDLDKWAEDQNYQRLGDTPFEDYKNHDVTFASYIPDEAQTFRRGDKVAFLSLFHDDENRQCHLVLQATGEPRVYNRVGVGYLQFRPRYYMNKILSY
jgi:hypothetical protein